MKRYIKSSYSTFNAFKDFALSYNENSKEQSKRCLDVCKKILMERENVPKSVIDDAIAEHGDNYQTLCDILKDVYGDGDFVTYLSLAAEFESMAY